MATITVTVKGKDYLVRDTKPGWSCFPYWAVRDGEPFGPMRTANFASKPGSVGAELVAAARAAFPPVVK